MSRPNTDERFWMKVLQSPHGCWLWQSWLDRDGYGHFRARGKDMLAHRWAYERFVGPIPTELVIDHLCRNRSCVNPAHLEPVTPVENMRRGYWASRTHCANGHEFTPENTKLVITATRRHRYCRACNAAAKARARDRRRQQEAS